MPYTEKQRRAGCAAATGKGKLGIPKKVGKEMCHAPLKKADGGSMKSTGSAGNIAPTIASSARAYADGGKTKRKGAKSTTKRQKRKVSGY